MNKGKPEAKDILGGELGVSVRMTTGGDAACFFPVEQGTRSDHSGMAMPNPLPRRLGRAEDVAHRLNVSTKRAYDVMRQFPKGVRIQVGRRIRVDMDKLEQWLAAGGSMSQPE